MNARLKFRIEVHSEGANVVEAKTGIRIARVEVGILDHNETVSWAQALAGALNGEHVLVDADALLRLQAKAKA